MTGEKKHRKFGLFTLNGTQHKAWEADYIKLVDKDKVEIYKFNDQGGISGILVAVVSLDKGQNVSEISD